MPPPSFDLVVPTAGRPALARMLGALAGAGGPLPGRVIVVDDRRAADDRLRLTGVPPELERRVEVLRGEGRGPAAARNAGWRRASAEWVAFLDDDVVPSAGWTSALEADLGSLRPGVGGSEGRIRVPLRAAGRPTDWERSTAGLERARWATADMAYRRTALAAVGGFDERFERAYREDADLALRVRRAGWGIARGRRTVLHPVRPADRWVSLRQQAGNADDVLMRALHGRRWREEAEAPRGRLRRHLAITAAGAGAAAAGATGHRRAATAAFLASLAGTAELAWARIAPGPRTREEVTTMLATSALIPPVAAAHALRGILHLPRLLRNTARPPSPQAPHLGRVATGRTFHAQLASMEGPYRSQDPPATAAPEHRGTKPQAVLLDRDGTLVADVPYNGDPELVQPMPGAQRAVGRLRSAGIDLAVISNQSAIGRGLVTSEEVAAVNRRVEELLGPLGPWLVCPHAPGEGCGCRKPAPGLVLRAAQRLGVEPSRCAVIGDIGADVEAARAAGARAVLVPTPRTRPEEVEAARETAPDLESAVDLLLRAT